MKSHTLRLLSLVLAISLTVASAADLVWTGAIDANWNTTTANWRLAAAPFTPTTYTDGDTVAFDDLGANVSVLITNPVAPGTITVTTNIQSYTFSGVIGGVVAPALVKNGSTMLTLQGANTFTGAITVHGGTLSTGNTAGFGASTATAVFTLDGGTTLQFTGAGTLVTGRSFVLGSSNVTVDITNVTGFLQVGDSGTPNPPVAVSITGTALPGTIQLTKTGPGNFGNNNNQQASNCIQASKYAGDTALLVGKLQSASASTTTDNALFGTGTLLLGDTSGANNVTFLGGSGGTAKPIQNNITVRSGNTGIASLITSNGSTNQQFSGIVTLVNHDLAITGGPSNPAGLSFTNAVTGTGNITVQNTSTNATQNFDFKNLTLTGNLTLVPSLTGGGTRTANVRLTSNATVSGAVVLNAGQSFSLSGFNAAVGALVGAGLVSNTSAANATLTINGNGTTEILSGVISNGTGAGTLSLTKTGSGSQLLGGANTYTGPTTVTSGSLIVDGSLAASAVSVANGALLRGNGGTVSGTVTTVTGAIIAPGDVVGTTGPKGILNIGTLNPAAGGTLNIRVANPAAVLADKLNVAAATQLDLSTARLSVQTEAGNYAAASQVIVFETTAGNFIVAPFGTVQSGANVTVAYLNAADTVVPAPSAVNPAAKVRLSLTNGVTPVRLEAFAARAEGAGVLLSWNAISEFQNAGFNLYRRNLAPPLSEWNRINQTLIPGRITNPDFKAYAYYDWASPGQFEYKLESVSLRSEKEPYGQLAGPVAVDALAADMTLESTLAFDAALTSLAVTADSQRGVALSTKFPPLPTSFGTRNEPRPLGSVNEPRPQGSVHRREHLSLGTVDPASWNLGTLEPRTENLNAAARWFTQAPARGSSFSAAKVVYQAPGVLLIPQSMLPAGFDLLHVALQREGRNLTALAMTAGGLVAFAPGYQDEYTDKDAIFLRRTSALTSSGTVTHAQGLFAGTQPASVTTPATASADYHDVYFDFDRRPYTFAPWFSSKYLSGGTTQSFTLETPAATSAAASLTINLWSVTESHALSPDHALQVLVNGQPAGQTTWSGGNKMLQLSFPLSPGLLHAGANQIDLVTPQLDGVEDQLSFLHSISIAYTRSLDGAAPLAIINAGTQSRLFEVSSLTSPSAWVVDARFPDRAGLVPLETQAQPDGTFKLRFNSAAGGTGQYLVVPAGLENRPVSVTKRTLKPAAAAAYLAVGPSQFGAAVQPLLMLRAKEGLRGTFIDQEQLFDYYNFGRFGPRGIQSAVRSLHPNYLLLLGRTTYDYRNYSSLNVDPLCPTFLVSTTFWSQATSDSMFGDLGRGFPEVAIGRLPANDAAELSHAVQRVTSYKGIPQSAVRVHAVTDRLDPEVGDFAAQAQNIAQANPDFTWQPNYLGATYQTAPEVTAAMKDAANGGADVLLYIGHGNAARLGKDAPRILDTDKVQEWTGNAVFLQSTCTANWMAKNESGYKSIALQAMTQAQGGISASIASSTYMNSGHATEFMSRLLANATAGSTRWGNALLKTQQWACAQNDASFYTDLGRTEQLFGDPAMPALTKTGRASDQKLTQPSAAMQGSF